MKNKMEQVVGLLNVGLGEKFEVAGTSTSIYWINEEGLNCYSGENYPVTLSALLQGEHTIKKVPYWETIEKGDTYYYINSAGYIVEAIFLKNSENKYQIKTHNIFRTKEEAKNHKLIVVKK